jgi:hypothetical protein
VIARLANRFKSNQRIARRGHPDRGVPPRCERAPAVPVRVEIRAGPGTVNCRLASQALASRSPAGGIWALRKGSGAGPARPPRAGLYAAIGAEGENESGRIGYCRPLKEEPLAERSSLRDRTPISDLGYAVKAAGPNLAPRSRTDRMSCGRPPEIADRNGWPIPVKFSRHGHRPEPGVPALRRTRCPTPTRWFSRDRDGSRMPVDFHRHGRPGCRSIRVKEPQARRRPGPDAGRSCPLGRAGHGRGRPGGPPPVSLFLLADRTGLRADRPRCDRSAKRGNEVAPPSIDVGDAGGRDLHQAGAHVNPERLFLRAWALVLLLGVFARLRLELVACCSRPGPVTCSGPIPTPSPGQRCRHDHDGPDRRSHAGDTRSDLEANQGQAADSRAAGPGWRH